MNNSPDTAIKQSIEKSYISHVLRYVGVGLISGSIVHLGTLGGGYTKYAILIAMGIAAFIAGTLLEKKESENSLTLYIVISVIMSIGVGMVSGGTQHYLDGPVYAAFLIPIGLTIGYFAFLFRDYRTHVTTKRLLIMTLIAAGLAVVLYIIAQQIVVQDNHHSSDSSDVSASHH